MSYNLSNIDIHINQSQLTLLRNIISNAISSVSHLEWNTTKITEEIQKVKEEIVKVCEVLDIDYVDTKKKVEEEIIKEEKEVVISRQKKKVRNV